VTGNLPTLPTIGAIAEDSGASIRDVERVIQTLGIKPVARAGIARVFSLDAVQAIRREITANRKEGDS
jgi:hypothetical protein